MNASAGSWASATSACFDADAGNAFRPLESTEPSIASAGSALFQRGFQELRSATAPQSFCSSAEQLASFLGCRSKKQWIENDNEGGNYRGPMKIQMTVLTLAALPWVGFAADV